MGKPVYQLSVQEAAEQLSADCANGLTDAEARRRLDSVGPNSLRQRRSVSAWKILAGQFKDVLILVLLAAALVSLVLGYIQEHASPTEGLLILAIVIAIALVGFFNEYKAEKTVEALKQLVGYKARVKRSGRITDIDAESLVPGDIVIIEGGQKIPADIRLFESFSLEVNEASLTGESLAVSKTMGVIAQEAGLGDRANMIYAGTVAAAGKGSGIVVATGMETEIGKIATMVEDEADPPTPMQKKLDQLGRQIGQVVLAACAIVFVIILLFDRDQAFRDLDSLQRILFAFTAAVALAVAAIPEGLAFVVRISLALGARRMAGRKALVRHLSAVEALGSTDVICSDKTGTLTTGQMTVRSIYTPGETVSVTGSGYETQGGFLTGNKQFDELSKIEKVLQLGLLCNDSSLQEGAPVGDPTEVALLVSAAKAGISSVQVGRELPRINEFPFSSERKRMTTIHEAYKGNLVAVKGATEVVLDRCTKILDQGSERPITESDRKDILGQNSNMAGEALRVLGFAYKYTPDPPQDADSAETDLVFAGLQGMMDPPRTEIRQVIETVTQQSGMRVIMITGDYETTAQAVAREVGITGSVINGRQLEEMDDEEFYRRVQEIGIYARVNPEHKIKIVKALQRHKLQVAMTGDGVNDAPAIKAADVGVAMGITGSDVAKETADLILLDDHFLSIVSAIEEGRGIYDNVRKFVNYLLSANIAEVISVLFGIILYGELIVTAAQLLFINIVTDGLPAIALGSDPANKDVMKRSPKAFQETIINKRLWAEMTIFGVLMSIVVLMLFKLNLSVNTQAAVASAFASMIVLEMVRLAGIRSDYRVKWNSNPWLITAVGASLSLMLGVLYWPPAQRLFGLQTVGLSDWMMMGIGGAVIFGVMKLVRKFTFKLWPGVPAFDHQA